MRACLLALCLAAMPACSASSLRADAGLPDAGPFSVSGSVHLHPLATRWYADNRKSTPSPEGLSLRLEDPFVSEYQPDAGVELSTAIGADGRFAFFDVSGRITVGLAAQLDDPRSPPLAAASENFLFEGGPRDVEGAVAFALPEEFVGALAAATGVADLQAQGFLLGLVVDEGGQPVAGASVEGVGLDPARVRYLSADLSPLDGASATGESGAFLVVGALDLSNFVVSSPQGYAPRKGLVRPGRGFVVVLRPG